MRELREQARRSIVRIWSCADEIVGVGFLVGERQILTCAHVVARALDLPDEAPKPEGATVTVDFPLEPSTSRHSATIAVWATVRAGGGGDIAGLVLNDNPPSGVGPAMLVTRDDLWGRPFGAFGFPSARPGRGLGARHPAGYTGRGLASDRERQADRPARAGRLQRRARLGRRRTPGRGRDGGRRRHQPGDRVAYAIPAALLVQAWPEVPLTQAIPACPYRGLLAFRPEDSEVFFGRDDVVARLIDAVCRQSLVAVVGPSGSGKSSVVLAGLIAEVNRRGDWVIAELRPGNAPLEALAASLVHAHDSKLSLADHVRETSELERSCGATGGCTRPWKRCCRAASSGICFLWSTEFEGDVHPLR